MFCVLSQNYDMIKENGSPELGQIHFSFYSLIVYIICKAIQFPTDPIEISQLVPKIQACS